MVKSFFWIKQCDHTSIFQAMPLQSKSSPTHTEKLTPHTLDTDTDKKSIIIWKLFIEHLQPVKYRTLFSLHPSTAGTGSTSLHSWEEGMLQDLVRRTLCWKSFGFLSSDNKEKRNLPLKCPTLLPLLATVWPAARCFCQSIQPVAKMTQIGGEKRKLV